MAVSPTPSGAAPASEATVAPGAGRSLPVLGACGCGSGCGCGCQSGSACQCGNSCG